MSIFGEMVTDDRLRCGVPHCWRTRSRGDLAEWICPKHWQLIGAQDRRAITVDA
jgi:hypothetical protein